MAMTDIEVIEAKHWEAMELLEMTVTGIPVSARRLRQAYILEREAATLCKDMIDFEPSRSVLHRSAASLAMECGEVAEAINLINVALAGNPPVDIADELRELLVEAKEAKPL